MKSRRLILGAALLFCAAVPAFAQVVLSQTNTAYTENFDSLGTSATASLPSAWRVDKQTSARTLGTWSAALSATSLTGGNSLSSTAGNGIYNFGAGAAASATDRAVGFLSSSSATKSGNLYGLFTNSTGETIDIWTISYDVEKYRNGSNAAGFQVQLYYSTDGSTWTSAGSTFLTQFAANADNSGFASAPGATTSVSAATFNLSIASGNSFYLAWDYAVSSGSTTSNAQALAIDNFSITASAVPEPSTYAAIAGALALVGVIVRRRSRSARA